MNPLNSRPHIQRSQMMPSCGKHSQWIKHAIMVQKAMQQAGLSGFLWELRYTQDNLNNNPFENYHCASSRFMQCSVLSAS